MPPKKQPKTSGKQPPPPPAPDEDGNTLDNCGICKAKATDGVQCGSCECWMHFACISLAPDSKALNSPFVFVFCHTCLKKFKKGSAATTNSEASDIGERLDKLIETLAPLLPSTAPSPPPPLLLPPGPGRRSYASVLGHSGGGGRIMTIDDMQAIQADELQRRSGVISGLPEKGTDLADTVALCRDLDISAGVQGVFRMGSLNTPTDDEPVPRPRLLKVHFTSGSCMRSIVSEGRRLRGMDKWKNVYVRRSMTKRERDYLHALYVERDRLTKELAADTTTKYLVLNERLVKFVNCSVDPEGFLKNGIRDKQFKFIPVSDVMPLRANPPVTAEN